MQGGDEKAVAEAFYRQFLWELTELVQRGGTAVGAAQVAKRVAMQFGLEVEHLVLPRPTRAERESISARRAGFEDA